MKYPSIYICQFSDQTIKIGRGEKPKKRIADHRARGEVFNIALIKVAILPCFDIEKAEALLIDWCAHRCSIQIHREWFHGVDFEACKDFASQIQVAHLGPTYFESPTPNLALTASLTAIFPTLYPALYQPSNATHCGAAYWDAKKRLTGHAVFTHELFHALDFIHQKCEAVRSAQDSGSVAPQWFDALNIFNEWEIDLFFYDLDAPDIELIRALADAMDAIESEKTLHGTPA